MNTPAATVAVMLQPLTEEQRVSLNYIIQRVVHGGAIVGWSERDKSLARMLEDARVIWVEPR